MGNEKKRLIMAEAEQAIDATFDFIKGDSELMEAFRRNLEEDGVANVAIRVRPSDASGG